MTTAHRPTWKAAVGRSSESASSGGLKSAHVATLDVASHTKLKTRQGSQVIAAPQSILRDSLEKLQQAEASIHHQRRRPIEPQLEEASRLKLLKQTADIDETLIQAQFDDADYNDDNDEKQKKKKSKQQNDDDDDDFSDLDQDSLDENNNNLSSDDDDDTDDDSDDEDAALQAELAKIRAEREAEQARRALEEAKREEQDNQEAALLGNPLLQQQGGRLKRKWNDDVVFRNQAKDDPSTTTPKRFINDTVRNDFHRRFLNKFFR